MNQSVNKVKPGVKVDLGGKERTIVFNFGSMSKFEKETGKSLMTGEVSFKSFYELQMLIWVGLDKEAREKNERITFEDVGDWLELTDIEKVSGAIQKALDNAFQTAEKKQNATARLPESAG